MVIMNKITRTLATDPTLGKRDNKITRTLTTDPILGKRDKVGRVGRMFSRDTSKLEFELSKKSLVN